MDSTRMLLTVMVTLLVSKINGQERSINSKFRRSIEAKKIKCNVGTEGYKNLKRFIKDENLSRNAANIMKEMKDKWFKTFPSSNSVDIMLARPFKKNLWHYFPSGNLKPISLGMYHGMLKIISENIKKLRTEVSVTDGYWKDLETSLAAVKTQLHNVGKNMLSCVPYSNMQDNFLRIQPKDIIYTYIELEKVFTENKNDLPAGHIKEKMAYTMLKAIDNISLVLKYELDQRNACN